MAKARKTTWISAFGRGHCSTISSKAFVLALALGLSFFASSSLLQAEQPSMLLTDHPLSETIWNVKESKQVEKSTLLDAILIADHVMIGERHDNPVHHEKQALLVKHLRQSGKQGQLILEMAEQRHQPSLDEARLEEIEALGTELEWEERGWPAWSTYQPIVAEALTGGMRIKAGNPDRQLMMQIGRGQEVDPASIDDLRWEIDYSKPHREDLLDELVDAHCGMMGRDAMQPLVVMQRLKDAFMARSMRQGHTGQNVSILIAGNGHTRKDRGVAMFLEAAEPTISIALIEVVRDEFDESSYPSFDSALYDFVWFTPRIDEVDPCEKFRKQLEAMKSKMEKHGQKGDPKN